jgi:hypothetical protein
MQCVVLSCRVVLSLSSFVIHIRNFHPVFITPRKTSNALLRSRRAREELGSQRGAGVLQREITGDGRPDTRRVARAAGVRRGGHLSLADAGARGDVRVEIFPPQKVLLVFEEEVFLKEED